MPYDYKEITKELRQKVGIAADEIFYYDSSPLEPVFEMYFQFCQENLRMKGDEFDIKPARFFFRNNTEVNAGATKFKDYYIVAVNSGTLVNLYYFFEEKANLFDSPSLQFLNTLNNELTALDSPIFYLMQQFCSQFTYYHELGHLIQKSPELNIGFSEIYFNPTEKCIYAPERHVYEFDADLYGSENTAFHVLEFWKKQDGYIKTTENLAYLISIGGAAVFTYFLKLMEGYTDMYYPETCHPHPLVRISYIIDSFIQTIEGNLESTVKLNTNKIIQDSFKIMEEIFKADGGEQTQIFVQLFWKERKNIEHYVHSNIFSMIDSMPHLVYNRVRK